MNSVKKLEAIQAQLRKEDKYTIAYILDNIIPGYTDYTIFVDHYTKKELIKRFYKALEYPVSFDRLITLNTFKHIKNL